MKHVKKTALAVLVVGLLAGGWALAQDRPGEEAPQTTPEADAATPEKATGKVEDEEPEGDSVMQKVSYCIGFSLGRNLKTQEVAVRVDDFVVGLRHGLEGAKPRMTDDERRQVMTAFQRAMIAHHISRVKKLGKAYLAENKKKDGVKTLPSGLQYKVLRAGEGKQPALTDTVTVHYKGTLIDGTEFDSSHRRGQPATFPVNGVIPGWVEALQLMKEGAKWELVIPSELAYGEKGAGEVIGPNAVLIFEVELIAVK